jgi:MoaA/NifB/PqqE/SkfB family radical SAM enzyme
MCHSTDPASWKKGGKKSFSSHEWMRIAEIFFPSTFQCVVGCGWEPTLHPEYLDILRAAKEYRVRSVGLVTNGQMLTREAIRAIVAAKVDELTISLHGVRKETYEKFMPKASYETLHTFLDWLRMEKDAARAKEPRLRLNYTVNPDNLDELREFFRVFGDKGLEILQVRTMTDRGDTAYRNTDLKPVADLYRSRIGALIAEARLRGVTILASSDIPGQKSRIPADTGLEYVRRYISPETVWRSDFRWEQEDYFAYCRRTGWEKKLLRHAFYPKTREPGTSEAMEYEVFG